MFRNFRVNTARTLFCLFVGLCVYLGASALGATTLIALTLGIVAAIWTLALAWFRAACTTPRTRIHQRYAPVRTQQTTSYRSRSSATPTRRQQESAADDDNPIAEIVGGVLEVLVEAGGGDGGDGRDSDYGGGGDSDFGGGGSGDFS